MRIATVVGNRPQFVKAAAVSGPLRAAHEELLIHTGQHYDDEMSQVFFAELGLPAPEYRLDLGEALGAGNTAQTAHMLAALGPLIAGLAPDVVLVYGDTNSTLAGGLVAAQLGVPVAHVEAGMRSYDRSMPEELNRVLTDHLSTLLLCPSEGAAQNLVREGVREGVVVIGDVMVDVARIVAPALAARRGILERVGVDAGEYLLVTAHRAGTVDDPARLHRLVELLLALDGSDRAAAASAHPRAPGRRGTARAPRRRRAAVRAARVPRLLRAARAGTGGAHRLRRGAEGGLPGAGALRDAAGSDGVGGDGGRRVERGG